MNQLVPKFGMVASMSACVLALSAVPATMTVGALKGPSGIGMVRLFEATPKTLDGSTYRLVAVASADLMTAKIVSGEYGAGVLPINVAAKLYESGVALKLAAIVGNGMVSFLCTKADIHTLTDLKGKRVFVAGQGATPDFVLRRLLRGVGMDPDVDVRLDYSLPYPEAAMALAGGTIGYAVLPEPFTTMARLASPSLLSPLDIGALWKSQTGQADYPMTAFVVSSKLARESPLAVKAFLDAYAASIAWVRAHPEEAGALVEKDDLGLKAAFAAKAIPRSAYVFVPSPDARPSVEALLRVFLDLAPASVGGALPDDGFYAAF